MNVDPGSKSGDLYNSDMGDDIIGGSVGFGRGPAGAWSLTCAAARPQISI